MTERLGFEVNDGSLGSMMRWNAEHRTHHAAIVCGSGQVTYAELNTRGNQLANALTDSGLAPGDRVAVFLPNCLEFVEVYVAAAKAGFVITPLNYLLTEREVAYILSDSGAKALIHSAEKQPLIEQLRANDGLTIPGGLVFEVGSSGIEDSAGAASAPQPVGPSGSYGMLVAAGSAAEPAQVSSSEPFYQGYTSGTTGLPKGCLQTQAAFVDHFKRSLYHFDHRHDGVMLIGGPLFHEAPALFSLAQLFYGGTVVVLPRFTPDGALAALEKYRCTTMGFAVPTMLDAMNAQPGQYDVSDLRQIVCGGAALLGPTIARTLERFPNTDLYEFYGATELGLMTTMNHRGARKVGSVGPPFPGTAIAILDDENHPQPPGKPGQIFITPIMMSGYHNQPTRTAEDTHEADGVRWFTVGDVGYLDEDGYLYIVDRKSHMIVTGGENVYPTEVESVLITHPRVRDIAVIGLPDERWGEAVTAVIVGTGGDVSVADLREFAAGKLAPFKTPKRVIMSDELPRTASGKILKHVLRAQHTPTTQS